MIRAYNELYLPDARRTLANSFDYAANSLKIPLEKYYAMFMKTDLATKFEKGDPFVISGKSGIELALLVVEKTTGKYDDRERIYFDGKTHEYWAGWALAFYQWYSSVSFRRIEEEITISTVLGMYDKYHEMDIMHFVDRMEEIRHVARVSSYLKKYREACGYSQSELAKITGIPVRTLQHYEQGSKSLDKANASYVLALANALACSPADLL